MFGVLTAVAADYDTLREQKVRSHVEPGRDGRYGRRRWPRLRRPRCEVGERTVRISNPDRVYFPATGATKLDLVDYYLAVGPGHRQRPAGAAVHAAPLPDRGERREGPSEAGAGRRAAVAGDRARPLPALRPARRRAVRDRAGRRDLGGADVDRRVPPVELPARRRREARRVAHRPRPDARLPARRPCARVAHVVHEVLDELGAVGWPKTSGGRGMHVYVRIEPSYGFTDVRRAALAFAREVERRAPDDVTTTWWRKDRDPAALFVDYNQNARDHTMAAAYSVRGVPDGHGVDADHVGRGRRRRAERLHDGDRAPARSPSSATSTPASTTRSSPSTSCSSGPTATSAPAPSTSLTTRNDRTARPRRVACGGGARGGRRVEFLWPVGLGRARGRGRAPLPVLVALQ